MANVLDDEYETLDFADEGCEVDSDERYEVAAMIADWFGRSVIDADQDLAAQIIARVRGEDRPNQYRDPTYGWKNDERA